jgi:aromatic-L-amino-acid decarboxylase
MRDRIEALEKISRQLEPSPRERSALRDHILQYTEKFIEDIYTLPAYNVTEDKGSGIYLSPVSEDPMDIVTAMKLYEYNVDRPGLNPASPGHLGYIPGGGIYVSALADYLADITNRYAGVFWGGPGAVRLENMLIQWMANVVGYPADCGGNLTSGGSIANLIGIVAARDAKKITSKEIEKSVIYLTDQAHHSVDKAIRIAGLAECVIRHIPMDERYRMSADALERTILDDRKKNLRPFLIIAAAGTTDTGAVDPMAAIGEIARVHDCWFHCDGAYGAFFILCDEGKKILRGMDSSDSLVMDPHKGLFLPYGSGGVLVKNKQRLYDSFWYQANYLLDALKGADELSPADFSPELTKHFRGLRLWLPLKIHGLRPFRAGVEEKLMLARYFWEKIMSLDGFEVGPYPDLSVVTYRYIPKRGDPNEFNQRLIEEVQKDGRVFLSSTRLDGKFILRLAVLAFRTHLQTIDLTLQILSEKIKKLES